MILSLSQIMRSAARPATNNQSATLGKWMLSTLIIIRAEFRIIRDELYSELSQFNSIVSRSRKMLSQSPPLTIGGTVLKESEDLVILGVTFYSKMEASSLGFQSSFSKTWYIEEVLASVP